MSSSHTAPSPNIVALFDFDGTVTYCDSLMPFLRSAVGRVRFWAGLIILAPAMVSYACGRSDRAELKDAVLGHYIGGWRVERLRENVERFNNSILPALCKQEAVARIQWHHNQGHRVILISASPEVYLTPWATCLPIETVLATRLEISDRIVTGRIDGRNCRGAEKVTRLTDYLGGLDGYEFHAYGDSSGDREMLAIATHRHYRPFTRIGFQITSKLRLINALL